MTKQMQAAAAAVLTMSMLAGCGAKAPTVTMDQAKVSLCNYTGIPVSMEELEVTDEDVTTYGQLILDQYNQDAKSDRTVVEDKDTVYITCHMYDENGELLEDETNNHEGYVTIGSGTTYEELEQGLVGAEVGKEIEIPVTFPDPYEYDETLSGAKVTAKATVEYIQEENKLTLDTLTDEQVKTAFDIDTVDGFYDYVRDYLIEQDETTKRDNAYNTISAYLLENCAVEPFPDLELKNRVDKYMASVADMCENYYQMSFSEYCSSIEMTEKEYRSQIEDYLSENIRLELILTAIGDAEDIQYNEDDWDNYLSEVLSSSSYETEEEVYAEYGEDYVKNAFRIEYVIDWLIGQADIVYTPTEENDHGELIDEEAADGLSEDAEAPVEEPVGEPVAEDGIPANETDADGSDTEEVPAEELAGETHVGG